MFLQFQRIVPARTVTVRAKSCYFKYVNSLTIFLLENMFSRVLEILYYTEYFMIISIRFELDSWMILCDGLLLEFYHN